MKIDSVDFFYLSMPEVRDVGDGSQDALLVRVRAGDYTGWGECEASPLVSIASWNCPMSHSACKPLSASVLGQRLDEPEDIQRINAMVRANSFDLLQTDHTLSGIDVALWDLLGKKLGEPVYRLLGYQKAYPKIAYASQLFGDDPQSTLHKAQQVARAGFRAAKFGWGPYGRGTVEEDAEQVRAAREGLGPERMLLVDAGTVWGDNVGMGVARLPALHAANALWLEEPFVSGALTAYHQLASKAGRLKLAGGEGCHNFHQAMNMIDYAGLGYVQIDAGRVGGITTAKAIADYAVAKAVQFVNHTFTTPLALSASVQPYAGVEAHDLCEYPAQPSSLARDFCSTGLVPDEQGFIRLPGEPGLGLDPDLNALKKYLVDVEIEVSGRRVFQSVPL
ncbi:MAG TPA: mandelate racemase/muconate lactonizing enzyme family protein [Candidatus Limnocylindrales bacterium]|jgi:L-alanine-DL-glutamate epimerase-like enolase superfamily enzyme|nr:mandelate racemase/muconate lactonizing enzyme family protein [Candidatus Limnocylindrales bacterium]